MIRFLLLTFFVLGFECLQSATLYQEDFGDSTTLNSTGHWRARHSANATLPGGRYGTGITTGAAGPMGANNRYAYIQHNPGSSATPPSTIEAQTTNWFLYSPNRMTSGNITPNDYLGGQLSAYWSIGSSGAIVDYYFAVQVASQWYALNNKQVTTNAIQNPITPLDLLNSSWYHINFTEGSILNLDTSSTISSSTLFAGNTAITGVGFYLANMTGNEVNPDWRTVRIDGLTITGEAVPEPSRALLIVAGFIALGISRSRKGF